MLRSRRRPKLLCVFYLFVPCKSYYCMGWIAGFGGFYVRVYPVLGDTDLTRLKPVKVTACQS